MFLQEGTSNNYEYLVNDPYEGSNYGHVQVQDYYKTSGQYFLTQPDRHIQVTYENIPYL